MIPEYLVQARDDDGSWCNVAECAKHQRQHAEKIAQFYADDLQKLTRVVRGTGRALVASFAPKAPVTM